MTGLFEKLYCAIIVNKATNTRNSRIQRHKKCRHFFGKKFSGGILPVDCLIRGEGNKIKIYRKWPNYFGIFEL